MHKKTWQHRKLILIAAPLALGFLSLGLILVLSTGAKKPIVIQVEAPQQEQISTFGAVKYVYSQDGKTVLEKHIPYADRSVGHQFYREDGTLRETKEDYPVKPGDKTVVLKSTSTWSLDGKVMVFGQAFRPDGSLWFTRKELDNGDREDSFYFADGWKFSTSLKKKGSSTLETTYFHKNGNVWGKEIHEKTQWNSYNEKSLEVFDASGKNKVFRIDLLGYQQEVAGFKGYGRLVTFYNASGNVTYRQWGNNYQNWAFQTQGQLLSVHLYDWSGSETKVIEVDETNDIVKVKTIKEPGGVQTVLRLNGLYKRKVPIETLDVGGQPKQRFLEMGTVVSETDKSGARIEHEDGEKVYPSVDIIHLMRPAGEKDLKDRRTQSQAEDRSILGARDDSDPVKWYHRQ